MWRRKHGEIWKLNGDSLKDACGCAHLFSSLSLSLSLLSFFLLKLFCASFSAPYWVGPGQTDNLRDLRDLARWFSDVRTSK